MLPIAGFSLVGLMACPALCGVWAYRHDQSGQGYRFLADRGVSPSLVWLSKHLVRLPVVVAYVAFAVVIALVFGHLNVMVALTIFTFWTPLAVVSYSVGQLVGQTIRSPIVSSFLACVCSGLLIGGSQYLRAIHMPAVFDLVPVAILFFVSWFHSRDWMEERNTVAAWGRFAASLLIPFALFYASIGCLK